uniref:Uncharacterized protein n=1 Tax=Arundo donax TaxID=35708 RepID=A0A0A8XN40_ARUDO
MHNESLPTKHIFQCKGIYLTIKRYDFIQLPTLGHRTQFLPNKP